MNAIETTQDPATQRRILVIEDEPDMLLGLEHNLSFEGYAVTTADSGPAGVEAVSKETPDIVLLDVMLPGMNGFEVLRTIRESHPRLPVIMLTAKGMESDKVQGLGLGADDYVTKPFSLPELLARIAAVLRRTGDDEPAAPVRFRFGDVEVDFEKRECRRRGKEVSLSFKEFEVLHLLLVHRGQTVTRERLLSEVWGVDSDELPTSRTVDTHIANLRRKLEGDRSKFIRTVHKVGYRFAEDVETF